MFISIGKATEAAEVLGVELPSLTAEVLKKAYRDKAKECHPDHHGNGKLPMWARVSWAQECLKRWLKQTPPQPQQQTLDVALTGDCRACSGTGRVHVGSGRFGKPLTMQCVICRGLGTVEPEEDDHD